MRSYSKAEARVANLRIAVHEDATRFGWLDKTKQHKLPTVLNSAARTFNALPLSSALGFPFAAPNSSAKRAQIGEAQRVALWKSKTSEVNDLEALQRLAEAKKAKRGSGNTNRTTLVGRMGVNDTKGVEPRPRPWALPKSATKKRNNKVGRRVRKPLLTVENGNDGDDGDSDSDSGDRSTDAGPTANPEAPNGAEHATVDATKSVAEPTVVVPGDDDPSRPPHRPQLVVSSQLTTKHRVGSGSKKRVTRPIERAQKSSSDTKRKTSTSQSTPEKLGARSTRSERQVPTALDEEPSIMDDMVPSNPIEGVHGTTADKAAIRAPQKMAKCSSMVKAGKAAVNVARLRRTRSKRREARPRRGAIARKPKSEPVPAIVRSILVEEIATSLVEEALYDICGPKPDWGGHASAASLGAVSTHDQWEEFQPPESSQQTPESSDEGNNDEAKTKLEDAELDSSKPGSGYQYPESVLAAASVQSIPTADPKLGHAAARRRLREWEAKGGRSNQPRRRPLSGSGGTAGLLRLTRRSKNLVPLGTPGADSVSAYTPGARALTRSSTMLKTGVTSSDLFVRRESPPRNQRVAIYA